MTMKTKTSTSMPARMADSVGVVLAGGQSRRMGRDKAALSYHGLPLRDHMAALLCEAGVSRVVLSGPGGIPDREPGAGPVAGIASVAAAEPQARTFLFVPVDMPLLSPALLRALTGGGTAAYHGWPLPAFLPADALHAALAAGEGGAVHDLLARAGVSWRDVPPHEAWRFSNANTPEEWTRITTAKTEAAS
jgi:molybdopterin-guanine dinucleotide biosynthesis protein A